MAILRHAVFPVPGGPDTYNVPDVSFSKCSVRNSLSFTNLSSLPGRLVGALLCNALCASWNSFIEPIRTRNKL